MDRDWHFLLESLEGADHGKHKSSLKSLLQLSLELQNRESVSQADIDHLSCLLITLLQPSHNSLTSTDAPCEPSCSEDAPTNQATSEVVLDLLKLLRNLCAGVQENQRMIVKDADILPQAVSLCTNLPPSDEVTPTDTTVFLKVALQLLGNACAGYPEGQERVWLLCYPQLFRHLLVTGNNDVIDMCCMVIHNCTASNAELRSQLCSPGTQSLIGQLLHYLRTIENSEWMLILVESLIELLPLEQLWSCLGEQGRSRREKLTLLHFVLSRVNVESKYSNKVDDVMELAAMSMGPGTQSDTSDDNLIKEVINERNLPFFESKFQHHTHRILSSEAAMLKKAYATETTNLDNSSILQVQITIALLRLLCRCAEVERMLSTLQQSKHLLDESVELLRQLAILDGSKSSGQHRTRLSKVKPTGKESQHPTFGMKRDLVQLIGNLSYSCPSCQDRVRELDGIHLLLNQCSIDHYNPYITQCAVWAIRNLCKGNPANQAFITELEQRGVADAHALLEFGVEVEIGDDGKIKLKRNSPST